MQAIEIIDLEAVAGEYGIDAVALATYAEYEGFNDLDEAAREFEDHYAGCFDTLEAFAEEYAESTGLLDGVPDHLRFYFDMSLYARDMSLNGDIWTIESEMGILVFWR